MYENWFKLFTSVLFSFTKLISYVKECSSPNKQIKIRSEFGNCISNWSVIILDKEIYSSIEISSFMILWNWLQDSCYGQRRFRSDGWSWISEDFNYFCLEILMTTHFCSWNIFSGLSFQSVFWIIIKTWWRKKYSGINKL